MEHIKNGTLIDNEELLFNELYEKTKDCGRVQFINLLMAKERENQELKKQLKELEFIVGLRHKRNLIHKFDKEYDEEDKKKNPNRDYAGIIPDAEEVYKRYYAMKTQQQEFIEWLGKEIQAIENKLNEYNDLVKIGKETDIEYYLSIIDERELDAYKKVLSKYKEFIGGLDEQ